MKWSVVICKYRFTPIILLSIGTRSLARVHEDEARIVYATYWAWDNWLLVSHTFGYNDNWTWNPLTEGSTCRLRCSCVNRVQHAFRPRRNFHPPLCCRKRFMHNETRMFHKVELRRLAGSTFPTNIYWQVYTTARREKRYALKDNFFPRSQEAFMWERKRHWGGL